MTSPCPRPKVLHVDSDTTSAKTLTSILRVYQYDAVHVYTAAEALVWTRLNWPDVVILDLTTEPSVGIQLAGLIVSDHPECRVLLLADPVTTPTLLNDSIMAYHDFPILAKPVDRQKILDFLAAV
jgi:DNA-binding NtrC family response regulator